MFNCTTTKAKLVDIAAVATHPSANGINDLVGLRLAELRTRAQSRGVDLTNVNQTVKAELRRAIWQQTGNLMLIDREVSFLKEDGQEVWERLQQHLPAYALFRSDRASKDQDPEAQDPLRSAIKEAIRRRENDLESVIGDIKAELELVAARTVEKIREMSPGLADQLRPTIRNKNWDSLFTVSLIARFLVACITR